MVTIMNKKRGKMKVQILNDDNVVIWEYAVETKETEYDHSFHLGRKPHMNESQEMINVLSIAKNKLIQTDMHHLAMYIHKHGTYNTDS